MADERYQWLDQEAAERLLRGEPVDAADDRARSQAERLAGALDAARTAAAVPAAPTALPGEAAALAAFRRATAERAGAAVVTAAASGRTEHADLGRVRLAPAAVPRRRWGRSVRYGLAAAVAAVTVGGVAVAAGTGVLPIVGPAPASSVTAGETVEPLVSEEPGIRKDPEAPPTTEPGDDTGATPGVSPSAGGATTAPPTGGPDGQAEDTSEPGTPAPGRSTAGTGTGGTGKDPGGSGWDPDDGTTFMEKAVKACRAYRTGKLDATARKGLTRTLRDGETLRRYCDRILGGATGSPEGGADDGKGESDGDGKREDGRDGDRDQPPGDTGDSGGDLRDVTRSSALDSARSAPRLFAEIPLGIAVTARVPLPV
ncbi:hypothetical protein ACFV5J_09610 [Streptomyces zaomyceticus]|uniref:hypothetical protein n=1 Tax=Streptomyces zaomyceticus TaxID=68286 RepID=UPI003663F381